MDGCVCTLIPDVVVPKVHQNNRSYVSSADLPRIHYARIYRVGGYTENLEKPQNHQNWGVGACTGMGACLGQYGTQLSVLV